MGMRMMLLMSRLHKAFATGLLAAAVFLSATAQAQQTQTQHFLFILDASGSMNQKLADGQTRFDVARTALVGLVDKLPASTSVALRVYGHQSTTDKKDCDDTQLVLGFGAASERKTEIGARIARLKALGYTPISATLQKAVEDFPSDTAGARTLILVSDGRETCKSDPCAVAKALADANVSLVVHTIGFGVDDAARRQLQCVANSARGKYYDARTSGELAAKLSEAVQQQPLPPPPPEKIDPVPGILTIRGLKTQGFTVTNSATGEDYAIDPSNRLELPPGIYAVKFDNGTWPGIEISAGQTTEIVPARISIARPAGLLLVFDPETDEELANFHQASSPEMVLIPGRYNLRTLQGFEWPGVELKGGETFVLQSGVVRFRLPGVAYGAPAIGVTISAADGRTATADIDHENRDLSLPPGRYVLAAADDPSKRIEVEVGEGKVVEIDLPR